MILSHKIALDPTVRQRAYFTQAAGTARFVWNWSLAEWNRQYEAGEKPNALKLQSYFNAIKYKNWVWLKSIHRDAHSRPFKNLQKAFVSFFKGIAERPKFKKKGTCRDSFYVSNDRLTVKGLRVRLPVIGWVRMREILRFSGKIMAAVVSREADRWFVSFQVQVSEYSQKRISNGVIGIDLGLTAFATLSTGDKIEAPKPLKKNLRRLRLRQRSLSRRSSGSKNRDKQRRLVARIHARIKHVRDDFLHKFTTQVCRENQAIGVETLNVAGMLRNRRLARAISDVAWSECLRQIRYKAIIFGCDVTAADRFEPSTKRCCRCGIVKETLPLSERVFNCESCGLICDRDYNASQNLLPEAFRKVTPGDRHGAN